MTGTYPISWSTRFTLGLHLQLESIRVCSKGLPGTNTPAYLAYSQAMKNFFMWLSVVSMLESIFVITDDCGKKATVFVPGKPF